MTMSLNITENMFKHS